VPLVRVSEVAKLLGVSPKTVWRWVREGRLAACVVRLPSGRIRIDLDLLYEELQAWGLYHSDRKKRGEPSASDQGRSPPD